MSERAMAHRLSRLSAPSALMAAVMFADSMSAGDGAHTGAVRASASFVIRRRVLVCCGLFACAARGGRHGSGRRSQFRLDDLQRPTQLAIGFDLPDVLRVDER